MKRKAAVLKVTLLGIVLGLVAVGGLAIYYYTLPPAHVGTNGGATSTAANSETLSSADGRQYSRAVQRDELHCPGERS